MHLQIAAAVVDAQIAIADFRRQHCRIDQLVDGDVGCYGGDHDRGGQGVPAAVRTPRTRADDRLLSTTISVTLERNRTSPPVRSSNCDRWVVSAPMPPRNFFHRTKSPSGTPNPKASAAALPGVAGPR